MSDPLPPLPARAPHAHKGTFGEVVVVGGSMTMPGAPTFSAAGALRTGAGIVRLAVPAAILPTCLALEPHAMGLPLPDRGLTDLVHVIDHAAVVVAGPGLGTARAPRGWIQALLAGPHRLVLDADGLNLAARLGAWSSRAAATVLTPHPGEWRRLAQAFDVEGDPVAPAQRPAAAAALARRLGAVVALKGHRTVVSDGTRTVKTTTGDAALSIPGSGDVLAGVIGALLAQGLEAWEATRLGCHLHGLAGDAWSAQHGPRGLVARDLAALLPAAMAAFEGDHGSGIGDR